MRKKQKPHQVKLIRKTEDGKKRAMKRLKRKRNLKAKKRKIGKGWVITYTEGLPIKRYNYRKKGYVHGYRK